MLPPEIRTTQQQCKPVLRPWLSRIFLSCKSAGFLCIYVLGKCFLPVIRFYSNYFILNVFSLVPMFFFKNNRIEIYDDDDDDDNEAQHLHGQSSFHIQTLC